MTSPQLRLPQSLLERMRTHRKVPWKQVIQSAVERKLWEMENLDRLLANSRMTGEDAERIGHSIKAGQRRRMEKAAKG